MGYYINPIRYEDLSAVNNLNDLPVDILSDDSGTIAKILKNEIKQGLILIDGYITANIEELAEKVGEVLNAELHDVAGLYKEPEIIRQMLEPYLPIDRALDPELIFAKLYPGTFLDYLDEEKVNLFLRSMPENKPVVLYGYGASSAAFTDRASHVIFIDSTPYHAALAVTDKKYRSIAAQVRDGFEELIRQTYFVDLELVVKNRRRLIQKGLIDNYVLDDGTGLFRLLSLEHLNTIALQLTKQPIRPKPIYIEGVWGGQYLKKIRRIPDSLADKVSWSFELIATEASVAVRVNGHYLDLPFLTLMDLAGKYLVGEKDYDKFGGYYPIRFNYDDTWHSNGNMSIQCHPDERMVHELYNDYSGQTEAYYIVVAGQHAKTFCGFSGDGREFLELAKKSENDASMVDYRRYVNAVESKPGRQFFLPSGTIHSSGRNQLVLELGSLTVSAYTYKIYDYNRMDITGKPRPIHTLLSERALRFERDAEWVAKNLVFDPVESIYQDAQSSELKLGSSELAPFVTSQIEITAGGSFHGKTNGQLVGLALVDGEEARIEASTDPNRYYQAKYLDLVILPASFGEFTIRAGKKQPVIIHKATLRGSK